MVDLFLSIPVATGPRWSPFFFPPRKEIWPSARPQDKLEVESPRGGAGPCSFLPFWRKVKREFSFPLYNLIAGFLDIGKG